MTSLPASLLEITRADPTATGADVWELVAQGWPELERGGQLATIADAVAAGRSESLLVLEAREAGRLVGTAFAQMLAGRAAVVTPPQALVEHELRRQELEDRLFARIEAELRTAGMHLAQVLLPFRDRSVESLRRAGFEHTSDLLYLVATSESFPEAPLKLPFELTPVDLAENEPGFRELLERTYSGTLDCP